MAHAQYLDVRLRYQRFTLYKNMYLRTHKFVTDASPYRCGYSIKGRSSKKHDSNKNR